MGSLGPNPGTVGYYDALVQLNFLLANYAGARGDYEYIPIRNNADINQNWDSFGVVNVRPMFPTFGTYYVHEFDL